jgi:hypothetical protein
MNDSYIRYLIDWDNKIESISGAWDDFAGQNKGGEIACYRVLNRDINIFIDCGKCREIYDMLIETVRGNQKSINFSFRCDSPGKRRFMNMEMIPQGKGKIEFISYLDREEVRLPVALLDISTQRSEEFVTVCSWCKRVKVKETLWLEIEEVMEHMPLFNKRLLPNLSHGVCPSCCESLMKRMV